VENLDRAVESFWKLLGVGPWHIYTYGKPFVRRMTYRGGRGDYRMRLALGRIGSVLIELVQPLEGDSIYAEFVSRRGYGLHHIGLVVDDMTEAMARARDAGIEIAMDGYGYGLDGDGGYAYLDTEDTLGITLELIELPKRRAPPERVYPGPGGLSTEGTQ
jgi:hypothetical protein